MNYSYDFFTPVTRRQQILMKLFGPLNNLFQKWNWTIEIIPMADHRSDVITTEQRINMFHLMNDVLSHGVEGDIIELGCHTGTTAMQMQQILSAQDTQKTFHVYDIFDLDAYYPNTGFKDIFIDNFNKAGLNLPVIHEGFFAETLPALLPEKISFIHLDCGFGGDPRKHKATMLFALWHIYPRMSPNSICVLMDYHDKDKTIKGMDANPGVKMACDSFFSGRSEKIDLLYGNHFSHAFFRKV